MDQLQRKMGLAGYKERTPEDIQTSDLDRLVKAEAELESIRHHIADMQGLLQAEAAAAAATQ
jgi:hypothetical protein